MRKIKLFFIPHAGGSAMGYMVMKHQLDLSVMEPVPLELAGRGQRIKEPAFTDLLACMEDLYSCMKPQIQDCQYAVFGHSLGSMLVFELVRHLEKVEKNSRFVPYFPEEWLQDAKSQSLCLVDLKVRNLSSSSSGFRPFRKRY